MVNLEKVVNKTPVVVDKGTSLNRAIEILLSRGISHLLVSDAGRIIGVLSEKDILSKICTIRTWKVDLGSLQVSSFYISPFYKVSYDDSLYHVIESIVKNSYGIVPVFKDEKLIGVVSKQDLMKIALKYRNKSLSKIVTYRPIIASANDRIFDLRDKIVREKISIIPIIEQLKVVGQVTDIRLLDVVTFIYNRFPWNIRERRARRMIARDIMQRKYDRLDERESIAQAANMFSTRGSKGILIFKNDNFTGIVTKTDILQYILYTEGSKIE